MANQIIRFGVIGCGLMGKEFASAAARWCHLTDVDFEPRIVAVCDANPSAAEWFQQHVPSVERTYSEYKELLADPSVEAIYCAVPHNLHAQIYVDIIRAGKHLLGEKPFGIDQDANAVIQQAIDKMPQVIVRCSSEFPFFPGAQQIVQWVNENRFGKIIEVEAGFWHSSDLDSTKPINWKRRIATKIHGRSWHACAPFASAFRQETKKCPFALTKIVNECPDGRGGTAPCETWDNAVLACEVETADQKFPMLLSTKRIAPGHANTWFIRIQGTDFSAEFSTKYPKQIASLPYELGRPQAWHVWDVPNKSAYGTITGGIFEFGFSDSILQMWAAFCDEIVNRSGIRQFFHCATPEEAAGSHLVFTAALASERTGETVTIDWGI
ncbi:Gfo/Idh/MocA family oxidoreductase [Paenibacillus filicis]|uniref:Gfo/Idh/MocA family oxidoreductase n=1 Tax=Paenibacillus gyeongsangnamensis TaxID=3388067 RepID=A0ABT4Q4E1_9BACL|nr:Gfo/Idh/MocA family oxidoreductase [Paenibacillus filicis]MCZ8511740.1 Gfo/Idh/MocA family oxidoreductase [Paenibacillus filicis]